jgi:hypothetical protein
MPGGPRRFSETDSMLSPHAHSWRGFAVLLALVLSLGCQRDARGRAAERRLRGLDTPFQFLLQVPGYRVDRFAGDSDLFSNWGDLTLRRLPGSSPATETHARDQLVRLARQAGWKPLHRDAVAMDPARQAALGIAKGAAPIELGATAGPRRRTNPTEYSCLLWVIDGGERIVVAYRIDSN